MSLDAAIGEARAVEIAPVASVATTDSHSKYLVFGNLTATELQVLRLLVDGNTTRQIAAELVVAVSTIDRHLTHTYTKLGARNRAEATAIALKHGLV
jgi:DNA-binding NarL/FixJ family response regulator